MRTLTLSMLEVLDDGRHAHASVIISEQDYHHYQHGYTEYFGVAIRQLGRAIDAEKEKSNSPLSLP